MVLGDKDLTVYDNLLAQRLQKVAILLIKSAILPA